MADYEDNPLSDSEKAKIVSDFIIHAPPGEFNEVFNDVRVLLGNDSLLKSQCTGAIAQYNKDQFTPCRIEGQQEETLITEHNVLNGDRYLDPRSKQSFRYDHIKKESSDLSPANIDEKAESWRAAFETVLTSYIHSYYPHGQCAVYGKTADGNIILTACIESHKFEPRNFWNGRWRSRWAVTFNPHDGSAELQGKIRAQVHYYEDGNVQLVSSKEVAKTLKISSESQTAAEFKKIVTSAESDYQRAISENYRVMSDTTFKALRRQLPVTRTKIDWNKILGYKIGTELKSAP